jgi:hypothetical protein
MHYEELHNLISSRNITLIESKRMKQAGHVEHTGEREINTGFKMENNTKRPL